MGEDQSRTVARAMKHFNLLPSFIFSSPLLRAKQMAAIIAGDLGIAKHRVTEYLIPGAEMRLLFDQINASGAGSVLLVGHEPHLHTLLSILLTDSNSVHMHFGNGTMACLDIRAPIQAGTGVLEWLMRVEELELMP
jgi:phosphohistidine phosphatase